MSDNRPDQRPLAERLKDVSLIESALRRAAREALLRHKRAGNPIAVSRDGRVHWIQPADIPVQESSE